MFNKYVQRVMQDYSKKEITKVDEIKALDRKVKKPAKTFAYIFGTLGALILGVGMCLAMNIIGGTTFFMVFGIVVGIIGIAMVSSNYFIYSHMLQKRKAKYAEEILAKSNEVLN